MFAYVKLYSKGFGIHYLSDTIEKWKFMIIDKQDKFLIKTNNAKLLHISKKIGMRNSLDEAKEFVEKYFEDNVEWQQYTKLNSF